MNRRQLFFFLVILAIVLVLLRGARRGELTFATYNIRRLGHDPTDMTRLATIVRETKADVLAIQEIEDKKALDDLAGRLSTLGHPWANVVARCAGKSTLRVGFLYDPSRARLVSTRELPELDPSGDGACDDGERAGLAATFEPVRGGAKVTLLAVHFVAGSGEERLARRRVQWRRAHTIADALSRENAVAILGDVNSVGYLDDAGGERSFVDGEAARANREIVTKDLRCTEYFHPDPNGPFLPSLLDHVVADRDLVEPSSVRVFGHCAALACKESRAAPADYDDVSDHCPVTFRLR